MGRIVWKHIGVVLLMALPLVVGWILGFRVVGVLWPYTVGRVAAWRGWLND